jgi:3-dehydroquinate synthase
MQKVDIQIKSNPAQNYPIFVGKNVLSLGNEFITKNFENHRRVCFLDQNVYKLFQKKIDKFCEEITAEKIIFPSGEENKNIFVIEELTKKLLSKNFGRKTLILNIGGGVVGDAGGFVAASFMRGIPFIQIPTSLLAMVDASVGGKVAVDIGDFKNSFGSFVSPVAIFADIDFLEKLPKSEFLSGLGECLKHGVLGDETILKQKINNSDLTNFVTKNIQFKKKVVEKDFRENGIRALLNLGHTVGHSLESFFLNTKNQISHGKAVALGVLVEADILEIKGILTTGATQKIRDIFLNHNLPVNLSIPFDKEKLWDLAQKDKKNENGQVFISRIENIGHNLEQIAPFKIAISQQDFNKSLDFII